MTNGVGETAQAFRPDWPRYIRITDIVDPRTLQDSKRASLPPTLAKDALIETGDVLLAAVGATYGKSYLYDGSEGEACFAGYLVRMRPNDELDSRFFSYWTECDAYWNQVHSGVIQSTIQNFSASRYKGLCLALPPLAEQHAVVRVLEHMDRRVRRYVRAKERLIGLLEEEKQAVINQAVTRGLDPRVRMKASGVEWLGEVPEHWEHRRLKTVLRPIDERSTTGDETLLSLRRDHGVVVYAEHFKRPPQSRSLVGFKLVKVGQLVVNRLQANNGLVFNSKVAGLVSPDYSVLEAKVPIEMQYLSDLLRISSYRAYFRRNATGLGTGTSGFLRLYDDVLLRTPVFLPPVTEQRSIIEHLANADFDRGAEIQRARRQIELVEEYRTRLIADVVTGKLDVREAAAGLGEEEGVSEEK